MKILVTGGCGFIGVNLCLFLKKKKIERDKFRQPHKKRFVRK
jgi:nucleoside-diphosphate-sugar epimerase